MAASRGPTSFSVAALAFAAMLFIARGWHSISASVVRRALPAPSLADRGGLCSDVGETRACWTPECTGGICPGERTLPAGAAPRAGWRCDGMRDARVCEDRRRNAGAFDCEGATCVQRRPRMPDDGQWDCVDLDGVAYCREAGEAAGVSAGAPDLGWTCGARRGHGERICVDLSPDLPDLPNVAGPWKCRFEHVIDEQRVCVRSEQPRVGGPCADGGACPAGASCIGGVCLPPRPQPACWFDADCGAGSTCRWGSCVDAVPR